MIGTPLPGDRRIVDGTLTRTPIATGWEAAFRIVDPTIPARSGAGTGTATAGPGGPLDEFAGAVAVPSGLDWLPATVPGTLGSVLQVAGRVVDPDGSLDLDEADWWFRTSFDADPVRPDEEVILHVGGLATLATIRLNGAAIGAVHSMYEELRLDVGRHLRARNEIVISGSALAAELRRPRTPRARWRSTLAKHGGLRWFRTTLLGRAPGFAPGPAPVGPWRPIVLERRRLVAIDEVRLRGSVDLSGAGRVSAALRIRTLGSASVERAILRLAGPDGDFEAEFALPRGEGGGSYAAELTIPAVTRWWPHTHGEPARHRVSVMIETATARIERPLGSLGFRHLASGPAGGDPAEDGLDLTVNGRRIFARGAVWTPADPATLTTDVADLRTTLERVRDAGMNLLRIPGIGVYESNDFHDLCDELGILVWQDLAFANLDYPFADAGFHATCLAEVDALAARIGWRPSVVVICGNSEVEQQAAMLGLPAAAGRAPFFEVELPERLRLAGCDAIVIPSTPTGGVRPFQTDAGIAHYYGVGGYRRPLSDARLADVRFAAECLAFSNVPDDEALEPLSSAGPMSGLIPAGPAWKAAIPRDNGSSWDFEDVRDHYLALLYGVDPATLRATDPARYLELSRLVTGELMAEVFGEWRRTDSRSTGGLVLWLRDQRPGAGWGVLDHRGEPKVAWHHLRRALAPVAVWMTDEGLNGIRVHIANDRPTSLEARLRVAVYQDDQFLVDEAESALRVGPGLTVERDVEGLLGRFVDVGWSHRFGPATRSLVVASLERGDRETDGFRAAAETPEFQDGDAAIGQVPGPSPELLSQAFRLPLGRPADARRASLVGLGGHLRTDPDGGAVAIVRSTRYAHGVRLRVPGFRPVDDAFGLEPGHPRRIRLESTGSGALRGGGITAANVIGRVELAIEAGS